MAAETFRLEIASPERMLVNEAVTETSIPGEQGILGILPGHAPLLSELGTGDLSYTLLNGQKHFIGGAGRVRRDQRQPRPRRRAECGVCE